MSAIGYLGANHSNASTAGLTGTGKPESDLAMQPPPGYLPTGGLAELWGGGSHPETLAHIGEASSTALERATDSVEGPLGGLKARLGSTVGPGPAGGVAQIRSTLGKAAKRLGL